MFKHKLQQTKASSILRNTLIKYPCINETFKNQMTNHHIFSKIKNKKAYDLLLILYSKKIYNLNLLFKNKGKNKFLYQ